MKNKKLNVIYSIIFLAFLGSSSYVHIAINIQATSDEPNIQNDDPSNTLSSPEYRIRKLIGDQEKYDYPEIESNPVEEAEIENESISPLSPVFEELEIRIKKTDNSLEQDLGGTDDLIPPLVSNKYARGFTVEVYGRLWGGIPGRFWNDETVYMYYNITESQYTGNQAFYFGNGQYEVGSAITDINGEFQIDLITSDLTASPFSKVGDINLLTWFNGSSAERLPGCPGAKNVTFFGQMDIQQIASVTNPSQPYSFTTSIVFENGTTVQTLGTDYHLNLDWSGVASDHDSDHTFTASNNHIYGDTAPGPSEDTVFYSASYDITQLGVNFFVENGTHDPFGVITTEEYTITTDNIPYNTEETLFVDAYFDITGSYLKGPQEIQMGSTVDFYANLSSSAGFVVGYVIDIYIQYGASRISIGTNTTVAGGEITYSIYFDPSIYTDITQGIAVLFEFYHSDFYPARFTNTTLTTILAVDIGSISIAIDNPGGIYYTTSMSIGFDVNVTDVNGNPAQSSRFQLNFPGIGTEEIVATTGLEYVTKTIPIYIIQNDFESIIVTAMFEDGGYYKYYAPGSPSDSDLFNLYHSLTLTLYHKNSSVVVTATTNEWNTSFWDDFLISHEYYELTAVDQSGRNPIGATISITFASIVSSFDVTGAVNYVRWNETHLLAAETAQTLLSHMAYVEDMIATGGSMPTPPSITLSIDIFGPDNTAPTIDDFFLTPDPYIEVSHDPYYNITLTIIANDVGSGVQNITLTYWIVNPAFTVILYTTTFAMTNIAPSTYQSQLTVWAGLDQCHIAFFAVVFDYAGYGVAAGGGVQTDPTKWYDTDEANGTPMVDLGFYRVGDVYGPVEMSLPDIDGNPDPYDPYVNITAYLNDSVVYSGMADVKIRVDRYNTITEVMEYYHVNNASMTKISNTTWFYQLDMDYNYEYYIYYIGVDSALPFPNERSAFYGPYEVEAIDTTAPTLSPITTYFNGSIATPEDIVTYNITISDTQTSITSVILSIDVTLGETVYVEDYEVVMTRVGLTDVYSAQVDMGSFGLSRAGTYALLYSVTATDGVGNSDTVSASMGVVIEGGTLGIDNLGAIIGGVVGGVVVLLAGLFLWFNRHTIQTYAKKQTFKRRLRDYLREIIEDIKKDGLEGRYKEGLLKSWSVLEGIGREFFNLPRYRSQTPTEFGRLLAYRGKIESELINTLLLYFERARYGHEEITEIDFNSGVRALLKIVDKIEVGEMKIES